MTKPKIMEILINKQNYLKLCWIWQVIKFTYILNILIISVYIKIYFKNNSIYRLNRLIFINYLKYNDIYIYIKIKGLNNNIN